MGPSYLDHQTMSQGSIFLEHLRQEQAAHIHIVALACSERRDAVKMIRDLGVKKSGSHEP